MEMGLQVCFSQDIPSRLDQKPVSSSKAEIWTVLETEAPFTKAEWLPTPSWLGEELLNSGQRQHNELLFS